MADLNEIRKMNEEPEEAPKKEKKHILFDIFGGGGTGKGVDPKDADLPRNFVNYFKILWRNITTVLLVNMMLIFGNFPIFFAIIAGAGYFNIYSYAPASPMFGAVYGASRFLDASPVKSALMGAFLGQTSMSRTTVTTIVLFALTALILFTFGPVRSGVTCIIRNIVRGEPVFLWDDFKSTLLSNLKQSIPVGIIDVILSGLVAFDIIFFITNGMSLALGAGIVIGFIYIVMRSYIYTIMITFDLSVFKIFKNSFILALAGMKRNLPAFLGILAYSFIAFFLLLSFTPLGCVFLIVLFFGLCIFTGIYGAYPKIKEVMIDPYYESDRAGAKPKRVKKEQEEK